MTAVHLAPGLLVVFMVMLAVVPLVIIWFDERRRGTGDDRLARLRQEVRLREDLARRALAEVGPRPGVMLPSA